MRSLQAPTHSGSDIHDCFMARIAHTIANAAIDMAMVELPAKKKSTAEIPKPAAEIQYPLLAVHRNMRFISSSRYVSAKVYWSRGAVLITDLKAEIQSPGKLVG